MTPQNDTTDPKLKAAEALLNDPDESIASMALETIFNSGKAEEFIAGAQDATDENIRRRAHQLGNMVQQERLLNQMVHSYEQARLDILTAMIDLDLLYDTSSSLPFLEKRLKELQEEFHPRRRVPRIEDLTRFMYSEGFYVPPLPWLCIEDYLLGDVLSGEGSSVPLVLAVLCRHLCIQRGAELTIGICNGFLSIVQDGKVCILEQGWNCRPLEKNDELCPLNNQQLLRLYLSQLLVSSIACWELYDTHLFLDIFQRLYGIPDNPLPYPFGNLNAPTSSQPPSK